MFSWIFKGSFLAVKNPVPLFFHHTHSYLNILILLITNALVNGCEAVRTIAPLSLIILLYCSQSGSKGIIVSHLQAVVPISRRANPPRYSQCFYQRYISSPLNSPHWLYNLVDIALRFSIHLMLKFSYKIIRQIILNFIPLFLTYIKLYQTTNFLIFVFIFVLVKLV